MVSGIRTGNCMMARAVQEISITEHARSSSIGVDGWKGIINDGSEQDGNSEAA